MQAGGVYAARRFPVRVGRDDTADLRSDEEGVWDRHFEIRFDRAAGFCLEPRPEAPTLVNGERAGQTRLRNGDQIQIGALKLQFWLSDVRQDGLATREALTWAGIAGVTLGQVVLIYLLLR